MAALARRRLERLQAHLVDSPTTISLPRGAMAIVHSQPMDADRSLEDFENFTHSVAAARLLLERAHNRGSLIEGLVLYASAIDALLRILVAHATAERDGSVKRLDLRYLTHDRTMWLNERKVYAAAREHGVLAESEFAELEALYDFRNVVIHRFIISGVTYDELGAKLDAYEVIYARLVARLEAIEQPAPPVSGGAHAAIRARINRKLGQR